MGLLLIVLWLGALGLLGGPALVLGAMVSAKARRDRSFWWACLAAALVSVTAQSAVVLAPFVRKGTYSFDLFFALILGWHLAVPAAVAAILWLASARAAQRPAPVAGGVAGLLLSIPALITLALPLAFLVPRVFGLRFIP